jgi:hypothetical protein
MAKKKKVKKFDIDDVTERKEYERLMDNKQATILDEMRSYDKTQGNKMLITVWWEETGLWDLDI